MVKEEKSKELQRIEAFSDGVFAIAITLLILEIKVPELNYPSAHELGSSLASLWPSYFAFFASFGSILIMWVNHHSLFLRLGKSSMPFIYANGFLLMVVTFIPFPTAVFAKYITTPAAVPAAVFYCGTHLLSNIAYNVLWITIRRPVYLLKQPVPASSLNKITTQIGSGLVIYVFTTLLSFWFPVMGVIINTCLWVLWATMSINWKRFD